MGIFIKKNSPTETKTIKNYTTLYPVNLLSLVKSKYIFNKIIEILDENKKLNILCYNKKMKRKLGITLDDYKIMSGKEFSGEKNGKGKEYKIGTKILIFEGKYLNEKKMEKEKNIMIMVN